MRKLILTLIYITMTQAVASFFLGSVTISLLLLTVRGEGLLPPWLYVGGTACGGLMQFLAYDAWAQITLRAQPTPTEKETDHG